MMCQRIGLPPISTIGFGRTEVSSESREPRPPARITAFTSRELSRPLRANPASRRAATKVPLMPVPLFDTRTSVAPLRSELDAAIERVLDSGRFVLGAEVAAFEQEFAAYLDADHAIGVANGTDAITIALRAMGVGPGDAVVVPSFTFY